MQGVSARSVADLVRAIGITGISKCEVGRLCDKIDGKTNPHCCAPAAARAAGQKPTPGFADAIAGLQKAFLARRKLGTFWAEQFAATCRTLGGCDQSQAVAAALLRGLIVSACAIVDACLFTTVEFITGASLKVPSPRSRCAALSAHQAELLQRPRVHYARIAVAYVGENGRRVVAAFIGIIFAQNDAEVAKSRRRTVAGQLRLTLPSLVASMDEAEAGILADMAFPVWCRAKIHSNNPLKRFSGENKRRTDVLW